MLLHYDLHFPDNINMSLKLCAEQAQLHFTVAFTVACQLLYIVYLQVKIISTVFV